MTISNISGANTQVGQVGINQATDSYSRNIQNQIVNAQKQLQELSSNEDIPPKEKMKKRQEIQQQINNLNLQLRQYQMQQRREKQQAKDSSRNDTFDDAENTKDTKTEIQTGLSQTSMTTMISAGNSIKQAKAQGSAARKMEGRAGVLESEIKLDQSRNNSTLKKEEELADVEQKAQAATTAQLSTLADANNTMKEAAKADNKDKRTNGKDTKTTGAKEEDLDKTMFDADAQEKTVSDSKNGNTQSNISVSKGKAMVRTLSSQLTIYTPVDICL